MKNVSEFVVKSVVVCIIVLSIFMTITFGGLLYFIKDKVTANEVELRNMKERLTVFEKDIPIRLEKMERDIHTIMKERIGAVKEVQGLETKRLEDKTEHVKETSNIRIDATKELLNEKIKHEREFRKAYIYSNKYPELREDDITYDLSYRNTRRIYDE